MKIRRPSIRRWPAMALALALTLGLTELALRAVFAGPLFRPLAVRFAGYVGDVNVEDAKQRMRLRLAHQDSVDRELAPKFHPHLGWTATERSEENPFGIVTDTLYLRDSREKILFFGNSFVEGYTEPDRKIPQILDRRLEEFLVLNFGVRGYGLDQMYLSLEGSLEDLAPRHVLVGVLYADLNRLLFQVNQGPKPYYEIEDGKLVLRGVPIPSDHRRWIELYPPRVESYLFATLQGLSRRLRSTRWATSRIYSWHPSQTKEKREEKKNLASLLTVRIRDECRSRGIELTFVLFPHAHHLVHEGWEEIFMRDLLTHLGIDYVDLQTPMIAHVADHELLWWRDVYTLGAHPNSRENQIMADHVLGHLCREFEYLDESCETL